MKSWAKQWHNHGTKGGFGFTIVELLIVIVVIAILAAVTIVAYNGIQNRAKASAVQSMTSQIGKKVLAYAPLNNDTFPSENTFRTAMGLPSTDASSTTYGYYASDDLRSFCVSVSNLTASPAISYAYTQTSSITSGMCTKNFVVNPGGESNTLLTISAGTPTIEVSSDTATGWAISGVRSHKITATTTGETRPRAQNNTIPIVSSLPIQVSLYVRNASAGSRSFYISFQGRNGSPVGSLAAASVTIAAGGIQKLTATLDPSTYSTTFAGAIYIEPMISRASGGAVGDVFYIDDFYASYGPTLVNYTGSLAGWSWTGTVNDSQSFGPTPIAEN